MSYNKKCRVIEHGVWMFNDDLVLVGENQKKTNNRFNKWRLVL